LRSPSRLKAGCGHDCPPHKFSAGCEDFDL